MLDDDPTGAQEAARVPIVLDWAEDVLAGLPRAPFHVVTNTRACSPAEAYATTRDAATAVLQRFPGAHLLLRGDSTLRAHLREEWDAVRDVAFPDSSPTLLLVPALPAAGRVTIDGVQLLERAGRRVPLDETEYARDGLFAYRSANLLDWAEERSYGLFRASEGKRVGLAELRAQGGDAVLELLEEAAGTGQPTVCAPDAAAQADLELVAAGLRAALDRGLPVIVRSAPTFAAVFCRTVAKSLVPYPRARSLLAVCGSYVAQSTEQIRSLLDRRPGSLVEVDVARLLGRERDRELAQAVRAARTRLRRTGFALVATPRIRSELITRADESASISLALAELTGALRAEVDLFLFKGGITSAVGVRDGLRSRVATVEGPIAPGISLWRAEDGRHCVVFPGNVGDSEALADVVAGILA